MLTYLERANLTENKTAKNLFKIMEEKQTNLCVAADFISTQKVLDLAEKIGEHICLFKTHVDIIEDFDIKFTKQLQDIARRHNFLIFEDRKFADIGKTVQLQYQNGIYHIADWADITNTHTVAGPGSIEALKEIGLPKNRGLLLLAEMSPKGNLATGEYTEKSIAMAEAHKDFVIGFISTHKLTGDEFLYMTPGVQLAAGGDKHGQQYLTPEEVIFNRGSDIIIVGRGITESENPQEEAKKYRQAGWIAYTKKFSK
jgi:orotidine 5'-phosphate decarboxylase subfamily 1